MILRYFVFVALGKLLMVFIRKFPPAVRIAQKIHFPIDCDLCLGFWVYTVSSIVSSQTITESYIPVWSEVVTGAITAWVVWVFATGWNDIYRVYEVTTDANG